VALHVEHDRCLRRDGAGGRQDPASSDLVGGVGKSAAYFQSDANYLYLRERVSKTPRARGDSISYAWVVLVQTVGADPYKYQWILSLNGVDETVNLWRNDQATAAGISFSPIFNDPPRRRYTAAPPDPWHGTAGRHVVRRAANYFVDWAIPRSVLAQYGIDTTTSFFWFATSANANNFNKDNLNCPFSPSTNLSVPSP